MKIIFDTEDTERTEDDKNNILFLRDLRALLV